MTPGCTRNGCHRHRTLGASRRVLLRSAAACLSLVLLPGCDAITSAFSNKDWREGVEELDSCIARVKAEYDKGVVALLDSQEKRLPTYTFDITKVSFEDVKELTVLDRGSEKGSVQVSGVEAPPWKKRAFLESHVDEKGAFFMGADPAYYRVQGEPIALADVFAQGCKMQRPGMRLLSFTFLEIPGSDNENDN
jgi:hypothetical protein